MRKSLRAQLIISILLLAVVPLLVIGVYTLRRTYNVEQQQAIALQKEIVRRVSTELETYIFSREEDLRLLVDVQGLPDLEIEQQKALLRSLSYGQDVYSELILMDSQGQTIAFESPVSLSVQGEAQSYAETTIFTIPRDSGETYYSSVQIDEETGEPFMTIAVPFFDLQTGNFDGVLAANFRFRPMWTLMEDISSEIHGLVYVVDNNNRVVAHPDRSIVLQRTTTTIPSVEGFAVGLAGEDAVLAHQFVALGSNSLVEAQGLHIVAEVPEDEALDLANSTLIATIVALVVATVIAGGMGTQVALRITRPIGELATTAQAISAGNLSRQVTVEREDEIGTLGKAFNSMTVQLRNLIAGLEQNVADRTASLEQTAAALQTILDSVVTPVIIARISDSSIVYVNEPATEAMRESHEMLLHRPVLDFYDDPTEADSFLGSLRESGSITNYELRLKRSDGTFLWGLVSSNLMTYENEPAFITTFIDITERKKQEEQSAFELRNQAVMNEIFQIASETDLDELLQQALDKILGLPWMPIQPEGGVFLTAPGEMALNLVAHRNLAPQLQTMCAMVPFGRCLCGRAAATKEIQFTDCVNDDHDIRFEGMEPHGHYNLPLVTDDNQIMGVMVFYLEHRHQRNENEIVFLKSLGRNLANTIQRKQTEQQLKEEQARTQAILESINLPLIISRISDGIVAYVNEPLAEMIRVPRAELLGQLTPDFYENPADQEAYLTRLREQGQVSNFDLLLRRGDGDLLWTLVSGRVINFQGEPAIISSLIDVTDRREAQAALSRRATELETVANVSTVATTALEPEELMQQVVDLTKERFNLYHAHIYLLNENKTDLILTSGAGEIGAKMVAEGRRIALSQEQSLVARAARNQVGVVINDVQEEPGFLPNPLLPETRAEMAVPLVVGDEVLGVLDVQADEVERFTSEDINIFTTLASQVAVALQNARRHNEALRALDELTRLQHIMVREGWEDYMATQERPFLGYAFNTKGAKPIEAANKEAVDAKEIEHGTVEKPVETAVPIAVRGELIGKIALRNPDGSVIPERKQSLIKTVAHEVSEALERARLTAQTQQALAETNEQARRLGLLNELSEAISRMTTIEDIASAVMNKASEILGAKHHSLYLIADEDETMLRVVGGAGEVTDVQKNELIPLAKSPMAQALEKRQIVAGLLPSSEGALQAYHVPLYTNEGPLGIFNMATANAALDEGERLILLQIGSLLSTTLENRRLFNQTKARADRERLLNDITQKIQSTVTMESALQTAVAELGQALKLKKAVVELSTSEQSNGHT